MFEPVTPIRRGVSICSTEIDEARSIGETMYYPHRVTVRGDAPQFGMHIDAVQLGPVTVGWLWYDTEVLIGTSALDVAYQVNLPIRGDLQTSCGELREIVTPSRAAVYGHDQPTTLEGWAGGEGRLLAVKIDRGALETHLGAMLNRSVAGPIRFEFGLDMTDRGAAAWWSLLRDLAAQLRNPSAMRLHPLMADSLGHCVMTGLLLAARHDHSAELHQDEMPATSPTIRRAVDYIEDHLAEPLPVTAIAEHVRLSVRALQEGFQLALGTTPTRYVRQARLQRVRNDLLSAEVGESVAQIAHRWGFSHLGRFATQYRLTFGESPSSALGCRTSIQPKAPRRPSAPRLVSAMAAS